MSLRCLPAFLVCLMPAIAGAGAWPAPEGGGQTIVTNTRKADSTEGIIGQETEDVRTEVTLFGEYGLTRDTTLGLVISGGFSAIDEEDVELRLGGHVRHTFWRGEDGDVASVELGASFPAERWIGFGLGDNKPESVSEAYVNLQYGRGWQFDWLDVFVSTGIEFRARGEQQDEELRLFSTAGIRPFDRLMALTEARFHQPLGQRGEPQFKLSPSLAYTMLPWLGSNDKKPELDRIPITIQLGVTWDAWNPDDGIALNLSVWRPF